MNNDERLQPARAFSGLGQGPEFQVEYENQQTIPLSGAKDARALSPFTMRVVLPNILTTEGLPQGGRITRYDAAAASNQDLSSDRVPGQLIGNLARLNSTQITREVSEYQLNRSRTRQQSTVGPPFPVYANEMTARAIALQIKAILNTPPLVFLINPQTMQIQHQKVAQFSEKTRNGYIYQACGEEAVKLSFSCTIGAFTVGAPNGTSAGGTFSRFATGTQFASKRDSAAFQQLMSVLALYKSAGEIKDMVGGSQAHLMVGNLVIEYDQVVYTGHMDSFSYGYESEKQNGGMTFDFEFTALQVRDVATPSQVVRLMSSPSDIQRRGAFGSNAVRSQPLTSPRVLSGPANSFQVITNEIFQQGSHHVQGGSTSDVNLTPVLLPTIQATRGTNPVLPVNASQSSLLLSPLPVNNLTPFGR